MARRALHSEGSFWQVGYAANGSIGTHMYSIETRRDYACEKRVFCEATACAFVSGLRTHRSLYNKVSKNPQNMEKTGRGALFLCVESSNRPLGGQANAAQRLGRNVANSLKKVARGESFCRDSQPGSRSETAIHGKT